MISVILPCYLGPYNNAAKDRPEKLKRAIRSVCLQSYTDWEMIIISDGCDKTVEIVSEMFKELPPGQVEKIHGWKIKRNKLWSGGPRNTGIEKATGDIICYLDSDDFFGPGHLQFIADNFKGEWIWFDEYQLNGGTWKVVKCNIATRGRCGTANIAHLRTLPVRWPVAASYASDDWSMIKDLRKHTGVYVGVGQYCICHIPGKYDY